MISVLQRELTTLAAQSKKRTSELRTSSEKSLALLDDSNVQDDESRIKALAHTRDFVDPFILACSASNAKACASALVCLQTLAINHGIHPERLQDVVHSLMEATHLGIAIQLKILQLLPVILQEYSGQVHGKLLSDLLQVCAELNTDNKPAAVHSAAYATLQQLITSMLDQVVNETPQSDAVPDAALVLQDICELANGRNPQLVRFSSLPITFVLELFELTLSNHAEVFRGRQVFSEILKTKMIPLLLLLFAKSAEFPVILRTTRIFYLVLRQHSDNITEDIPVIIYKLVGAIKNPGKLFWKRTLVLEVLHGVSVEYHLISSLYTKHKKENLLGMMFEAFAACLIDSHLPLAVHTIGSAHSSSPLPQKQEGSAPQDESLAQSQPEGLSRMCASKIPFIDLLDKSEPPKASPFYPAYLVIASLNAFIEGINKLLHAQDTYPAELPELLSSISDPVSNCFSILLGTDMEVDLYRQIIRSVQRIVHSAGATSLDSMRDEYMRLLVQFSYLPPEPEVRSALMPRIITCIRALFNLGYALGNQLESSWSIIVGCIVDIANRFPHQPSPDSFFGGPPECKAIEQAFNKLISNTKELQDSALIHIISACFAKKPIQLIQLAFVEQVSTINAQRLADMSTGLWDAQTEEYLAVIKDTQLQESTRLYAAQALNNTTLSAVASSMEESYPSLLKGIAEQARLPPGSKTENETRHAIRVAAVRTLNSLLDKYNAKLTSGWEEIFEIIGSVFSEGEEGAAYSVDIVKTAFHTLELICQDFLENLPYECVVNLTRCLDRFARQSVDLNTSFTATSLFWNLCDYLMNDKDSLGTSFDPLTSEAELVPLAESSENTNKFALWMLAVMKLAEIASEPQHQVKTGAIHIFFRLFGAHGSLLPEGAWATCQTLVLPKLIRFTPDVDLRDAQETRALVLKNMGSLYASNIKLLTEQPGFKAAFGELLEMMGASARISSVDALTSFSVLNTLVEASDASYHVLNESLWEFWRQQNVRPEFDTRRPQVTVEALNIHIDIYPKLANIYNLSVDARKDALRKIADCVKNSYPPVYSKKLQDNCMEKLALFAQDEELQPALLSSVSELAVAKFNPDDPEASQHDLTRVALDKMSMILGRLSRDSMSPELRQSLRDALSPIVTLMKHGESNLAAELYLTILADIDDGEDLDEHLIEGGRVIIMGKSNSVKSQLFTIKCIDSFFKHLGAIERLSSIDSRVWDFLLDELVQASMVYERGRFTPEFIVRTDFPMEELSAGEFHGSTEPLRPKPRRLVSFYCLGLLHSFACRQQQTYASKARELFTRRALMTLNQCAADSQLQGLQPLQKLLEEELLFILQALCSGFKEQRVDKLLRRCIGTCHGQVLSILLRVFAVQNE